MVQPKHNPQEALERMKLMMKYDSSKTLTENVEVIKEQTIGHGTASAIGSVAGAGTAIGIGAAAAASGAAIGSAVPILGTVAGALVGYGIGTLIEWGQNADHGAKEFKSLMGFCSNTTSVNAIPRGLTDQQVRTLAYQIEDAKGSWNDDEDAIVKALSSLVSVSDLCYLNSKITGGLYNFLDDLTDSPDEWKMFTRPISDIVEDSKITVVQSGNTVTPVPNPNPAPNPNPNPAPKTSKYHSCPDTFPIAQFCKNSTIGKVQGCLGITADNAFGPKTQAALEAKGLPGTEITQNSVDTACAGGTSNKPDEGEETTMVDPTQR
jgi:hypothetical protein